MKKHVRVYLDAHDFTGFEFIACWICQGQAVDVHHIDAKGMGGNKDADDIENLVALCRDCHSKAHAGLITKEQLK